MLHRRPSARFTAIITALGALPDAAVVLLASTFVSSRSSHRWKHGDRKLRSRAPVSTSTCPGSTKAWQDVFKHIGPYNPDETVDRAWEPYGNTTLLVEADISGWNNVRMSWEAAVCLAYKSRRTYRVAHIAVESYSDPRMKFWVDGKLRHLDIFDYYDEASFRRVVPSILDSDPLPGGGEAFFPGKPYAIEDFREKQHVVYRGGPNHIETRSLAQYANAPHLKPHAMYVRLVEAAFRLRADMICLTIRRLMKYDLQPLGYVALHRRRGDFIPQPDKNINFTTAVEHVVPIVRGQTVLVLTDQMEPQFLQGLKHVAKADRIICWGDLKWEGDEKVWDIMIDMLAAVAAKEFIGSPFSTVSTGIVRWRVQARTHRVGDELRWIKEFHPGYQGWPSPGAKGTFL